MLGLGNGLKLLRVLMITRIASTIGATGLATIAAIHVFWAAGGTWPARDRMELAEMVNGNLNEPMPGPLPCLAVAGAAAGGAALVAGVGPQGKLSQFAQRIGGGFLVLRGVLPHTVINMIWPDVPRYSERFLDFDKRFYQPISLTLGLMILLARCGGNTH